MSNLTKHILYNTLLGLDKKDLDDKYKKNNITEIILERYSTQTINIGKKDIYDIVFDCSTINFFLDIFSLVSSVHI